MKVIVIIHNNSVLDVVRYARTLLHCYKLHVTIVSVVTRCCIVSLIAVVETI